uniref:Transporter n=1 Tax=Caenorhabditis japonica TaxID=281687 RepID=A0A8R1E1H9_CAEJA
MASKEDDTKQSGKTESTTQMAMTTQGTTTNTMGTTNTMLAEVPPEEREGFENGIEFVLTCLGLAVGLGNIWRFPTRAFENGGSAFLIPYLTFAFILGFPSVYFEFLLGQYNGKSPPVIFRRVMPILEGVGWMGPTVASLVAIYYIVIISWISIYMVNIIRGDYNLWSKCNNPWNEVGTCIDMISQKKCRVANPPGWPNATNLPAKLFFINNTCVDADKYKNVTLISATEQYFMRNVINPSNSLYEFDSINWPVLAAMTVCWTLTALGIMKGAKIMGKISYVSVLLPYFLVIVLFFRGITLDGAGDGITYYLGKPDFSKLLHGKTWIEALKQLCFSLSVGHGALISLASYSKKHNNVFKDTSIVILGDTCMSLVGGAAVFSTMGFLAKQRGVTVPEVVKSGLSLAFVVYPEAMTQMPFPWLWSFLFFLMLFLLGASTEIALVEVFCSCFYDQSKSLRKNKWIVVTIWCFSLYIIGLLFSTKAGIYWFEMFDSYTAGFSSVCTLACEFVIIMLIYGYRNFSEDIIEVMGQPRNSFTKIVGPSSPWFIFDWSLICPVIAVGLVVMSFMRDYPYEGDAFKYPMSFDILGWFLSFLPVFLVPLFALLNFIRYRNSGTPLQSLFMLQKQHPSYPRISKGFDEDQKLLQEDLPDKEPWDEDDESPSPSKTRATASGDGPATIDVTSTIHQFY